MSEISYSTYKQSHARCKFKLQRCVGSCRCLSNYLYYGSRKYSIVCVPKRKDLKMTLFRPSDYLSMAIWPLQVLAVHRNPRDLVKDSRCRYSTSESSLAHGLLFPFHVGLGGWRVWDEKASG